MSRNAEYIRLPIPIYEAAKDNANRLGISLSEYIRTVVGKSLPPSVPNRVNVSAKKTALTFTSEDGMRERVNQLALEEGISANSVYVRILSEETGVKPCHVVVVKEK